MSSKDACLQDNAPVKDLPPVPNSQFNNYNYIGINCNAMNVMVDGSVSTPIHDENKISDNDRKFMYTHVGMSSVIAGDDDSLASVPLNWNNLQTEDRQFTLNNDQTKHASVNHFYAVVDKANTIKETCNPTVIPELHGLAAPPLEYKDNIVDLYASIDWSQKRRQSVEDAVKQEFIPKFNGGRRVSDGMINTPYFIDERAPPQMPKCYANRKWDLHTHLEEPTSMTKGVRKGQDLCNRNSLSTENMLNLSMKSSESVKSFQSNACFDNVQQIVCSERLTKSHNAEDLKQLKEFKKQHRRRGSHETVDHSFFRALNDSKELKGKLGLTTRPNEFEGKLNTTGNTSPGDSLSSLSTSKDSVDDLLRDGGHSVDMSDLLTKANDLKCDELPEGWQEVNDGAEMYYWHIWTGTIQYERPTRSTAPTSRSISPFSSQESASSSRASSVSETLDEKNLKISNMSQCSDASDRAKQIISFPVHSMGWMDVEEEFMVPKLIGDTVNNCISILAEKRHDLWNVSETWAEGADIKLLLEGETLKLFQPGTKLTLHVQPIAKMRVWGVNRVETRDFAYIARDQITGKHRCHMFRCHGHVSGRSITNALQVICNRVLDEKRKFKEQNDSSSVKPSSDMLRPPVRVTSSFNEKPYVEQKKFFTAKYVGETEVTKSAGVEVINKAVAHLSGGKNTSDWATVLVEVTTSEIKTVNCIKQEIITEHRVRFISFLGVAHDERFGAYIVAIAKDAFICHVFFCERHAGTLTKAIEEACKLRFEKMLDGNLHHKSQHNNQSHEGNTPSTSLVDQRQKMVQHTPSTRSIVKEKTKTLTSSIAGVFNKNLFNKKQSKKKNEDTQFISSGTVSLAPASNEHLVKYFGSMSVDIGTGIEIIQNAVKDLAGGDMMIGYLEIQPDCLTLLDSQRTALSKRIFDLNRISYCGMTSDRKYFGIIVSRGKGKYTCHVFQEYKPNLGQIVSAIHEVL